MPPPFGGTGTCYIEFGDERVASPSYIRQREVGRDTPSFEQALLDALDRRPDCGMAASKILVWEDPSRIDKAGHLIYPDGQNRGRGSG